MTRLSVNINKVALLRNSRVGNYPDLYQFAKDCEEFGAQGITVHPRPDERHIRYADIPILKNIVKTEYNIEGYPSKEFMELVIKVKPDQCTLVPDAPGVLTSNTGWDTKTHQIFLTDIVSELQEAGIRVSLFLNADMDMVSSVVATGTDRIELYTGTYATAFLQDKEDAVKAHAEISKTVHQLGIGINAGHDLNLQNLKFYKESLPNLKEVSIGHAFIADSLYYGLKSTIQMYRNNLC
ncbi:pyridoxine 5'-phosphate synthase [Portibacter lacus]|uniref:Pyridoxine 5'-phosphate synthase n=1 Tax=Portibacter lacus TaxID=1099794 RepID=A0AA37SRC8_9BACT|nr:pyridoxine 5'-phosphate synthase [Portibacter lacus]GLR19426.1 pyridoxine 5'-phosphate synthase [Portibacter lacus]